MLAENYTFSFLLNIGVCYKLSEMSLAYSISFRFNTLKISSITSYYSYQVLKSIYGTDFIPSKLEWFYLTLWNNM